MLGLLLELAVTDGPRREPLRRARGALRQFPTHHGRLTPTERRQYDTCRDGKELLIPNEDLITGRVTNWSYSSDLIRQSVIVGVSYGSDVHLAMRLAVKAAVAVTRILEVPKPTCLLKEFGDSALYLELRFWIQDPANGTANVRSDVMLRIWNLFREHGIEFPLPQRDLTLRNPDAVAEALLNRFQSDATNFASG